MKDNNIFAAINKELNVFMGDGLWVMGDG